MEHFGALPEAREEEEAEIIRREFEYVDSDGKHLATAAIELEGDEVAIEYKTAKDKQPGKGRKLRSFVLRGEKDGAPTEIDMMALANRFGVTVVSSTEHLENYHFDDTAKLAYVPPLESPLDVGVFLHELGHADQFHDERFDKIAPLYGRSKTAASGEHRMAYSTLSELLEAVVEAVPDAAKALDTKELEQLRRLEDRRNDQLHDKVKIERQLDEQMGMRDRELQDLVDAALRRRMDVDALDAELKEVMSLEHLVYPPLQASPRVAKLVDRMTDLGFRFAEEASEEEELQEKGWRPEDAHIVAERGEPPADILSELSITTAEQARKVLESVREMHASDADMRYDPAKEELIVRLPYKAPAATAADGVTKRSFGKKTSLMIKLGIPSDEFERYVEQRENADRQVRFLEERTDAAFEEAKKTEGFQQMLINDLDMTDIAALPTRMMERDATRRALQWLRTVRRDAGIDLLASHRVRAEALAAVHGQEEDDCVGSTVEGMDAADGGSEDSSVEATIVADLKRALKSYGADRPLRPPDDGPGFMPIAGHDRTKKS